MDVLHFFPHEGFLIDCADNYFVSFVLSSSIILSLCGLYIFNLITLYTLTKVSHLIEPDMTFKKKVDSFFPVHCQ